MHNTANAGLTVETTDLTTGNGQQYFAAPLAANSANLISCDFAHEGSPFDGAASPPGDADALCIPVEAGSTLTISSDTLANCRIVVHAGATVQWNGGSITCPADQDHVTIIGGVVVAEAE